MLFYSLHRNLNLLSSMSFTAHGDGNQNSLNALHLNSVVQAVLISQRSFYPFVWNGGKRDSRDY